MPMPLFNAIMPAFKLDMLLSLTVAAVACQLHVNGFIQHQSRYSRSTGHVSNTANAWAEFLIAGQKACTQAGAASMRSWMLTVAA